MLGHRCPCPPKLRNVQSRIRLFFRHFRICHHHHIWFRSQTIAFCGKAERCSHLANDKSAGPRILVALERARSVSPSRTLAMMNAAPSLCAPTPHANIHSRLRDGEIQIGRTCACCQKARHSSLSVVGVLAAHRTYDVSGATTNPRILASRLRSYRLTSSLSAAGD